MLAPRSSALSSGAIAGAVVGSVVGALLIAFCVFPFVIRARRRRYARDEDAGLAEMGQGPGGPILTPQDLDDSSYKRTSGSGPESGTVHDVPQPQPTALPQGATVQHSSPTSPTSPATGTDLSSQRDDQQVSPLTATAPTPPPAEASSPSHHGSAATAGRQSTRDPSVSDSYGSPSRELTAITSVGLTHEPESFDRPSDSHQHGHFHLKDSLRSLFQSRQSSQQQRRDSRRSTQGGKTESARSPSILTDDVLAQSQPTPSGLEFDTETPGLAWDYYHDPTLGIDVYGYYSQSALPPTTVAVAPSTQVSTLATFGSAFPTGQAPPATGDVSSFVPTRPIPEEPDAISPDSDVTVTPAIFSRQSTFLQGKKFPTSLQRTDSLPTTIVADLPSPPLLQYSAGPSGNPMEMMKPTNSTESAWMLEHEMRRIEKPPPPPVIEPVPIMSLTVDDGPGALFDDALMPQAQSMFPPVYPPPYHSPPLASSEGGVQIHEDLSGYYNPNGLIASDYSTPPPSTGPSVQSTPETWLTPYTASPSPPAENRASINGQLRPPSPGLSASLSPSPGPPPSPGLSPEQSRGRSPVPSAGTSPGRSPGRSPAGPPGGFICPECGVTKNSYHQFNHHRRYHDRPYACNYAGCELRFGTITHLKRHVNDKHVKTRKFYCTQPDCAYSRQGGKSFPRKDNWKRHMMNKHHIDPKDATDEENLEGLDVGDVDMDGA